MKSHRPSWFTVLVGLSAFFGIGLALANALLGPLNQDEGLYLQCSRCVAHGLEPYRDFFFPQAPALPYFYGLFRRIWFHPGSLLGVLLSARIFTAFLGLVASALAARMAFLLVRDPSVDTPPKDDEANLQAARLAALATWLCTACAPAHSYFSTIVKTYSLTSLFLSIGMLLLVLMQRRRSPLKRTPLAFDAGIFLGLAAVTRLSIAFVLPPTCLCLWLAAPKGNRRTGFRDALFVAIGALFTIVFSLGRAYLLYPEGLRAGLSVHGARDIAGLFSWLSLRAGFLSRTFQAYPLFWCLAAVAILTVRRPNFSRPDVVWALGFSVIVVSILHFLTPFPYDDYQTPLMPVFAAVVASLLAKGHFVRANDDLPRPVLLLFSLAAILALASPLLMNWVVLRQDRFWFEMKSKPDILVLRDAGRRVRAMAEALPEEDLGRSYLLTQDAYLAAESGLAVPRGLELGPFTLFPELPDDEAKQLRVLNPARVRAILDGRYPLAATSGYTFAIAYPDGSRVDETLRQSLLDELARHYDPVETIPDFGQCHTPLTIWRRKTSGDNR